jgi:hypothetical protein
MTLLSQSRQKMALMGSTRATPYAAANCGGGDRDPPQRDIYTHPYIRERKNNGNMSRVLGVKLSAAWGRCLMPSVKRFPMRICCLQGPEGSFTRDGP